MRQKEVYSVYWDRFNWNYTYENSRREFELNVR